MADNPTPVRENVPSAAARSQVVPVKETFGAYDAFYNLGNIFPQLDNKKRKMGPWIRQLLSTVTESRRPEEQSPRKSIKPLRFRAKNFNELFGIHNLDDYVKNSKWVTVVTLKDLHIGGSVKAMRLFFVMLCQFVTSPTKTSPDFDLIVCLLDLIHRVQNNLGIPLGSMTLLEYNEIDETDDADDRPCFDVIKTMNSLIIMAHKRKDRKPLGTSQEVHDVFKVLKPITIDDIVTVLKEPDFSDGYEQFVKIPSKPMPENFLDIPSSSTSTPKPKGGPALRRSPRKSQPPNNANDPPPKKFRDTKGNEISVDPNVIAWDPSSTPQNAKSDAAKESKLKTTAAEVLAKLNGLSTPQGTLRCYLLKDELKSTIVQTDDIPESPDTDNCARHLRDVEIQVDAESITDEVARYTQRSLTPIEMKPNLASEVQSDFEAAQPNIPEAEHVQPVVVKRQDSNTDTRSNSGTPSRATPTTVKMEIEEDVVIIGESKQRKRKRRHLPDAPATKAELTKMIEEMVKEKLNENSASSPVQKVMIVPQMMQSPHGPPYFQAPPGAYAYGLQSPQQPQFYHVPPNSYPTMAPPHYPFHHPSASSQPSQIQYVQTPPTVTTSHVIQQPGLNFGQGQGLPNPAQQPARPTASNSQIFGPGQLPQNLVQQPATPSASALSVGSSQSSHNVHQPPVNFGLVQMPQNPVQHAVRPADPRLRPQGGVNVGPHPGSLRQRGPMPLRLINARPPYGFTGLPPPPPPPLPLILPRPRRSNQNQSTAATDPTIQNTLTTSS